MRIIDIKEQTVPISRYADTTIASGDLNTSVVAVSTDFLMDGRPVIGYGFASLGRFAQRGLILERFAPRLLAAREDEINTTSGRLDPARAWICMMKNEKPGGHGERSVAVGALDMALWDISAKVTGQPLYHFLAEAAGRSIKSSAVPVYAGGGYYFPKDEISQLTEEIKRFLDLGYTRVKIKVGGKPLAEDLKRVEAALAVLPASGALMVDAMNRYNPQTCFESARAFAPYQLGWFEDACDPLDYQTQAALADAYPPPLATGEALFSHADARNLLRYGGLRPDRDRLLFDPVHSYGLPEYMRIVAEFEAAGWPRTAFLPHGGHLFSLHVAAGLGLGGSEANPHNFQPFGGFDDGYRVFDGKVRPPEAPGIGFETRKNLWALLCTLFGI